MTGGFHRSVLLKLVDAKFIVNLALAVLAHEYGAACIAKDKTVFICQVCGSGESMTLQFKF
jgi:hypothetical protein